MNKEDVKYENEVAKDRVVGLRREDVVEADIVDDIEATEEGKAVFKVGIAQRGLVVEERIVDKEAEVADEIVIFDAVGDELDVEWATAGLTYHCVFTKRRGVFGHMLSHVDTSEHTVLVLHALLCPITTKSCIDRHLLIQDMGN